MTYNPSQWGVYQGQTFQQPGAVGGYYYYGPSAPNSGKSDALDRLIQTAEMHRTENNAIPTTEGDSSNMVSSVASSMGNIGNIPSQPGPSAIATARKDLVVFEERRGLTKQNDLDKVDNVPPEYFGGDIDMTIVEQPPPEIRTRTPSENRMFSCRILMTGPYGKYGIEFVKCSIVYRVGAEHAPVYNQSMLGGTKLVRIVDGHAVFSDLSVSEASTKHKESEFCLEFVPVCRDEGTGQLMEMTVARFSEPFYAYSHKKVLLRRKLLQLRAISKPYGVFEGGENMHVVGTPFIFGPSLAVVLRTPHGDVVATELEVYMNAVLFFKLPPYPHPSPPANQIRAILQVTNDGRSFSNPIDFIYYRAQAGQAIL